MEKRILGKTGLPVTVLGYGAMELRNLDGAEAARVLNAVLDSGITYVDTSPDYGPSEAYIGQAIARRRHEFYLASKCGCNIDAHGKGQEPGHIWSREKLIENLETSLRLLQTDHLDVWQLHGPRPDELDGGRLGPVIETMQQLKQQGKVRFIGISFKNGRAGDELHPAGYGWKYGPEFIQWGVFDLMQMVYGGLVRTGENVITQAAQAGLGMVIRGVVKRYFANYDELFEKAGLDDLRAAGDSRNAFLIRFALTHPGLSTCIIGTKSVEHLQENVRAASAGRLADDVYREAKRRLDAAGRVAQ